MYKKILSLILLIMTTGLFGQNKLFYRYDTDSDSFPMIYFKGRINSELAAKKSFSELDYKVNVTFDDSYNTIVNKFTKYKFTDTLVIHVIIESSKTSSENITKLVNCFSNLANERKNIIIRWYSNDDSVTRTTKTDSVRSQNAFNFWDGNIENFINGLSAKHSNLIVQVCEKENITQLLETIDLLKLKQNGSEIIAGFIFAKTKKRISNKSFSSEQLSLIDDPQYVLFNENIHDNNLFANINIQFKEFLNNYYKLSLSIPYSIQTEYSKMIKAMIIAENDTFTFSHQLTYPKVEYTKFYLDSTLYYAERSIAKKDYLNALDTLLIARKQIANHKFDSLVALTLKIYGEQYLNKNSNPYPYFKLAEDDCNILEKNTEWYQSLKLQLLDNYYKKCLDNDTISTTELISINQDRLNIIPDNQEYVLERLRLSAKNSEEKNNLKASLGFYADFLMIKPDNALLNNFKRNINIIMTTDFQNKEYSEVYDVGQHYFKYIKNNFKLRYYYAFSCLEVKDYPESISNFEWLINHWDKKQSLASWYDAFSKIEYLYTQTFEFNKALELNQRYFRQTSNFKLLKDYVENIRLSYLKPIIDAFKLSNVSGRFDQTLNIYNKKVIDIPDFVSNIYLMTGKNVVDRYLNKQNINAPTLALIKSNTSFPAIEHDQNHTWLINNISFNHFIIIELKDTMNLVEEALINEIVKKKEMAEPWKNFQEYEYDLLRNFSSVFITNIIGRDIALKSSGELSKYRTLVSDNSQLIKYMVIYNQDGDVVYSVNFNKTDGDFKPTDWQQSITSNALYRQNIVYKGQNVVDICNPVFRNNIREYVIRIGFFK